MPPMTKLKQWMTSNGVREWQVAEVLGVERSTINLIKNGKRTPSLTYAYAIEKFTKGDVPLSCWIKDEQDAA